MGCNLNIESGITGCLDDDACNFSQSANIHDINDCNYVYMFRLPVVFLQMNPVHSARYNLL